MSILLSNISKQFGAFTALDHINLEQQVNRKEQAFIAPAVGFNWVQGSYYDKLSEDHWLFLPIPSKW